ncbi:MAG TPA: hypothetical protein VF461_22720, partial [Gemmatimonadaceae bacterium]
MPLAVAALALACSGGEPTGDLAPLVRFESNQVSDTVGTLLSQPLIVRVNAPRGTPVVFRADSVPWLTGGIVPSVYFMRSPNGPSVRETDTLTTDANGRVSVYARLGGVAAKAVVTAVLPTLGDSAQMQIDILPGPPARIVAAPSDTAVYVGRAYALRTSLTDGYGNSLPIGAVTIQSDSTSVTVQADGKISGQTIGRARIVVRSGTFTATVWASVVPQGRIAARADRASGAPSTALVLVNLDGSAYRSFPLQPLDAPHPSWHPSGGYLVASLLPTPGSPNPVQRLAALDTATGQWRSLPGSGSTFGDGQPVFSRDGQWIYLGNPASNSAYSDRSVIYRVRSDGSGTAEQVGYDQRQGITYDDPSPSPDGTRVAMTFEGSSGMYTLITPASPPLGTPPGEAILVGSLPTGGHPYWSPVSDDVLMFGTEGMWLMTAGARTISDRRYLASAVAGATGGFTSAAWSPDGKWIVARSGSGLILVEVATDRVIPLPFGSQLANPA